MRIFFCSNQVSYAIAHEASRGAIGKNILVIRPDRVRPHSGSSVRTYEYNPLLASAILLVSVVSKSVEVVLPHGKGGRLTRWMMKYSRNLAFVDDGMDTFRDHPKNLEIHLLRHGARFYTFSYEMAVAKWLSCLELVPVCAVSALANDEKPALNLDGFNCLVVESPGVNMNENFDYLGKVFHVRHPNSNKTRATVTSRYSESGANCSVEKTILNFDGALVVGESMVMVFALCCIRDFSRLHIFLSKEQYLNLSALHPLINECGNFRFNLPAG